MREVQLANGGVALVDDEDYERVAAISWYRTINSRRGEHTYARHTAHVYLGPKSYKNRGVYLHRLILGLTSGDARVVDHINGDGLDNQKSNLRACTRSQNLVNRRKSKRKIAPSSQYVGVDFSKNRWRARTHRDGKEICLGYFDTEREAALAYSSGTQSIYGEFAVKITIDR